MSEKKQILLRLPEALYWELREEAAVHGASVNETVIRLLREALSQK